MVGQHFSITDTIKRTNNSTAVALFDHLLRSIFVAQQWPPHVDRPHLIAFFNIGWN
jgi:hypothetical protein